MSFIFNSIGDVAVLLGLTVLTFSDLFAGTFFRMASEKGTIMSDWYKKGIKRIPVIRYVSWWFFPMIWLTIKLLVIAALYIFYQQTNINSWYGRTCDVVTLLIIFNMALNALWVPVFFEMRAPITAFFICLALIGTGVAIAVFFRFDNNRFNTSFWLFVWYPIWCCIAGIINFVWIFYEYKKDKKSKSTLVDNQ
jgi:tryptophan-rich sensory protein